MNRSAMAFKEKRSKALVRKDSRERKPPPNQDYRGRSGRQPGERRPLERREAEQQAARHGEGEEGLQEHEHQRQRRFGGLLRVQREKWRSRQKCNLKARPNRAGLTPREIARSSAIRPLRPNRAGLKRSERRNIAIFRIQCAGFVATHAGAWQTDLYGQRRKYYHRYCIWEGCCDTDTHKRKPALDDAAHVLLKCPLHRVD